MGADDDGPSVDGGIGRFGDPVPKYELARTGCDDSTIEYEYASVWRAKRTHIARKAKNEKMDAFLANDVWILQIITKGEAMSAASVIMLVISK